MLKSQIINKFLPTYKGTPVMLEIFKQEKSFLTRAKEKNSFRYLLRFDTTGASVEVCDKNGKVLTDIDFRVYNGLDREILQLLEQCREDEFFHISWEDEGGRIQLSKYPRLIELLRQSDKLFTEKDELVSFAEGISSVDLNIIKSEE